MEKKIHNNTWEKERESEWFVKLIEGFVAIFGCCCLFSMTRRICWSFSNRKISCLLLYEFFRMFFVVFNVTIWLNSIFEIYNCGCSSLSSASTMTTLKKRAYIFQNGKKPHRHTHGHTLTVTLLHSILNILRLLIYYDHTIINEKCALKFSASRSTINKK